MIELDELIKHLSEGIVTNDEEGNYCLMVNPIVVELAEAIKEKISE
jgi:hypothetical protein